MEIKNLGNPSVSQLIQEINHGGKFVIYQYCISIVVMTFKRPSAIYYIPPGESRMKRGWQFSILSFLFGWWGIPWGPIYTIGSLATNLRGGKDITDSIMNNLAKQTRVPHEADVKVE